MSMLCQGQCQRIKAFQGFFVAHISLQSSFIHHPAVDTVHGYSPAPPLTAPLLLPVDTIKEGLNVIGDLFATQFRLIWRTAFRIG
jgi:hypothetical protein